MTTPTPNLAVVSTDNHTVADGGYRYVYTAGPGRGAAKVTRVQQWFQWDHWCVNHIYEPATAGIPVEQVLDAPMPKVLVRITPPDRRRSHARGPQDGHATVYLCEECRHSFFERRDAAIAAIRFAS